MGYKYAVLGAGIQGTAAAYDMAKFGEADSVLLMDVNEQQAIDAARRVNSLTNAHKAVARGIDVNDAEALIGALRGRDACLSAVPYYLNPYITECALAAKVSLCDLGGNTDVVFRQLKLDNQARETGISVIPDCGLMPGMGNTLAAHGIEQLDACEEVQIRCGGLPQTPRPPLGYKLVFSIEGLTNEYFGQAALLRDGRIQFVETFAELETLSLPEPLGECEAFTTSGGTSTCPWTYEGQVKTYEYKTIRYPGHYAQFKLLRDLGLLELEPVDVKGQQVVPRDLFHAVAAPRLQFPEDRDLVILRVTCRGKKDGKPAGWEYTILDYHDERTGFNAMSRTTGFPAAIVAHLMARGKTPKGAIPLEKSVPGGLFIQELERRGIAVERRQLQD